MSDSVKRVLRETGFSNAFLHGKAERIVSAILDDLTDRAGLKQKWFQIDREVQEEIVGAWLAIVEKELSL